MHPIPEWNGMNLTQWVLLITFIFLCLYDVFAYIYYGRTYSISIQLMLAAKKHYELAFITGAIIGHIFLNIMFPWED